MKRPGFTIAEMAVSLGVLGVLSAAMGSLIVLGTHAIPDDSSPSTQVADAANALDLLHSELALATGVTAGTGASILFSLPDRTGDAIPDTVRYQWAGAAGSPLTRTLNGGAATTLIPSVEQFGLSYLLATANQTVLQAPAPGAETRIASISSVGVTLYGVNQDIWGAQYFRPSLSADAVSWSITRIRVKLQTAAGLGGAVYFALHLADADGLPFGAALATGQVNSGVLSAVPAFFSVSGLTTTGLAPPQGVSIVVYGNQNPLAGNACLISPASAPAGYAWFTSNDTGRNWNRSAASTLQFQLDAVVTTQSTTLVEHRFLRAVDIDLRAGSADSPHVRTRAPIVNLPETP